MLRQPAAVIFRMKRTKVQSERVTAFSKRPFAMPAQFGKLHMKF